MPRGNKLERMHLHFGLERFINDGAGDTKELAKEISEICAEYPAYGIANAIDFRKMASLFARLFAYNNKHYFVYKAIDDPNKLGFLSRKQYMAYEFKRKKLAKQGISGSQFSNTMERFLSEHGTMASPYKMLKRAFKENKENLKFLSRYFPLASDGKRTINEDKLIQLCDAMMQIENGVEIQDATVQECYDLDFHGSNIAGSSQRCATNSCMHGKKVGAFYDSFGAHGKMVYYRGKPVGRFLMWDLPDGKKYIDRLYVRGEYMNEALAKIDEIYPNNEYIKYPALRENGSPVYRIPLCKPEFVTKFKPETPYIDTFGDLIKNRATGEYFITNHTDFSGEEMRIYEYVSGMRSVGTRYRMSGCPLCNEIYWSGDSRGMTRSVSSTHKLYCKGYEPRTKELKEYLEIFRKYVPLIKEARKDAGARELVF